MVKGELLKTIKEEMEEHGHGHIYPKTYTATGTLGEHYPDETFQIGCGLDCSIFVEFRGRTVKFSSEDMTREAVRLIEEVTE